MQSYTYSLPAWSGTFVSLKTAVGSNSGSTRHFSY